MEPSEVTELRAAIQKAGRGAWVLDMALQAECSPGGTMYDDQGGYMNPSLALTFIELLGKCPSHRRAAVRLLNKVPPTNEERPT